MDAEVLAALARWPAVPAVYGWLALTARGEWRLRGERIGNAAIVAFIARNYALDGAGRAYFQNGPQRVYVDLESTPWIWRSSGAGHGLLAHTGAAPRQLARAALLDDGRLALVTDLGPGTVDDRDAARVLHALCDGAGRALDEAAVERWMQGRQEACFAPRALQLEGASVPVERLSAHRLAEHFGFDPAPRATADCPQCPP
jgi:hypothetical protein